MSDTYNSRELEDPWSPRTRLPRDGRSPRSFGFSWPDANIRFSRGEADHLSSDETRDFFWDHPLTLPRCQIFDDGLPPANSNRHRFRLGRHSHTRLTPPSRGRYLGDEGLTYHPRTSSLALDHRPLHFPSSSYGVRGEWAPNEASWGDGRNRVSATRSFSSPLHTFDRYGHEGRQIPGGPLRPRAEPRHIASSTGDYQHFSRTTYHSAFDMGRPRHPVPEWGRYVPPPSLQSYHPRGNETLLETDDYPHPAYRNRLRSLRAGGSDRQNLSSQTFGEALTQVTQRASEQSNPTLEMEYTQRRLDAMRLGERERPEDARRWPRHDARIARARLQVEQQEPGTLRQWLRPGNLEMDDEQQMQAPREQSLLDALSPRRPHIPQSPSAEILYCAICHGKINATTRAVTPCNHHFHRSCIGDKRTCPSCSKALCASDTSSRQNCSICIEQVDNSAGITTTCGHRFCRGCITNWFDGNQTKPCPNCRKDLGQHDIT